MAGVRKQFLWGLLMACIGLSSSQLTNTLVRAQPEQGQHTKTLTDWYSGIKASKVVYAVNCGGENDLQDNAGVVWKADTGYQGGAATSGCGMHRWPMVNSEIYHAERWGEQFSYFFPLRADVDSLHTLVLRFSECYFWEPGMKVFDIYVNDSVIVRDMDPFAVATQKLLPGDIFVEVKVVQGKVYFDGQLVNSAIVDGKVELKLKKGKADNPKINGLMLVEGGIGNTHKGTFDTYQNAMYAMMQEKVDARMKAEQFFAEDAYDYEHRIDGRGPFNQILQSDYVLEATVALFLIGFFQMVMPTNSK